MAKAPEKTSKKVKAEAGKDLSKPSGLTKKRAQLWPVPPYRMSSREARRRAADRGEYGVGAI